MRATPRPLDLLSGPTVDLSSRKIPVLHYTPLQSTILYDAKPLSILYFELYYELYYTIPYHTILSCTVLYYAMSLCVVSLPSCQLPSCRGIDTCDTALCGFEPTGIV